MLPLIAISPEKDDPRENEVLGALLSKGLERYHVRKPAWTLPQQRQWLETIPERWRSRLMLHQHHALAVPYGCSGMHFKDGTASAPVAEGLLSSRSCHTLTALVDAVERYDTVFFSPVFPSVSKLGYGPKAELRSVVEWLRGTPAEARRARVVALGGITPANVHEALALGFDGVAVLGCLWQAQNPVSVFEQLQNSLVTHAA